MNKDYLQSLNTAQLEVVTAPPSNLLVLAGAGSGKTCVLVNRIAWLLQNQPVTPANILAVTFTNKAAREMRDRLQNILGFSTHSMWVGTFHGLAHRLLRTHWQEANLLENFQIIDSEDQFRIIKRIHKSLNLDEERWPIKQTQWFINKKKDEGMRAENIQYYGDFALEKLTKIYQEYQQYCDRSGSVDFAEILLRSHELFLNKKEILDYYRERFHHILVDEFQDTNSIQYAWIRILAENNSFLTAVGDDDQSIYGWRGAKIENIHRVSNDFPGTKIIRLEQNYRSTGNILAAANAVITKNSNRLGKNLWTEDKEGELITFYSACNEFDEARFVINSIKQHINNGSARSEIAILYRSNAQSRVLEEQLIQAQIPYRVYGGLRFFDRAEIKDALAYLRLIINKDDDAAFERIINLPTRGIGNVTLNTLRDFARKNSISLWSSAKHHIATQKLSPRALSSLQQFIELIQSTKNEITALTLDEQITHVLFRSALREFYIKDTTERGQSRIENLDELINACKQFSTGEEEQNILTVFLSHIALETGEHQTDEEIESVQLMTLHAAKGLEFPIVFICGMESGLFPHQLSMDDINKIEEERRLCYVGMTRAMQKLYLSYAQSRRLHGTESYRRPSKFLYEIPRNLLLENGALTKIYPVNTNYDHNTPKNYTTSIYTPQNNVQIGSSNYHIGQQVTHSKFGSGLILNFEGTGENLRVQVKFAQAGIKWLVAAYAKLEVK